MNAPSGYSAGKRIREKFAEGFSAYVSDFSANTQFLRAFSDLMKDVNLTEFKNSVMEDY